MSKQSSQPPDPSLNISDSVLETVQIGGVAGRDLNLTQIQGGVGTINVLGSVQVDQAPLSVAKPLSQQEYRWRRVLLDKVKSFWIDGVLAKSLHTQVLLELGLEERNEFVQNPLSGVEEFPLDSGQVLPEGTTAANIFEGIGAGRTLLILGEPGSGKTVTLLKLAESLIARTENDLSQPLPVVMNLSSWAKKRQSITDWLVQELYEIYGASKSLGKAWVDQEQLILLLDGLDEVEDQYRNDCVKTLNQFIQGHGLTEMVVCSRLRDYESLAERLKLRSAIYVQPLTSQQIDQFLERTGESLSTLKNALQQNFELQVFASSPLILSIMSWTYQNCSTQELIQAGTSEDQHQQIFDTYIDRMFMRREATRKYSREQTLKWLTWLAQRMMQTSQTAFSIEKIQPDWLQRKVEKLCHTGILMVVWGISISWMYIGIFNLSPLLEELAVIKASQVHFLLGFLHGAFIAIIQNLKLIFDMESPLEANKLETATERFTYAFISNIIFTVPFLSLYGFILFGSFYSLIFSFLAGIFLGIIYGIFKGINFALFFPSSKHLRTEEVSFSNFYSYKIEPIGNIKWSWVRVKRSLFFLIIYFGICVVYIGFTKTILLTIVFLIRLGISPGVFIDKSSIPNQGIIKSARNSMLLGISSVLSWMIIVVLISHQIYPSIYSLDSIFFGLGFYLLWILLLAVLTYDGGAWIKHAALRLILHRNGYSPWNYFRFLDYAVERLFLQKVGGGYIFVHRMLLEHFAAMKL